MECCDCSLVHDFDFALVKVKGGHAVVFRVKRNQSQTKKQRSKRRCQLKP